MLRIISHIVGRVKAGIAVSPGKKTAGRTGNTFRDSVAVLALFAGLAGCTGEDSRQDTWEGTHPDRLQSYVTFFNDMEDEHVVNYVPDSQSYAWMEQNVPLLECPDSVIEQTYYYRWWTFRKHLKETPDGYVFTEFITPVGHAGKHNTISCALGHHIYEGRWLQDDTYLDQYIKFWFLKDVEEPKSYFHSFSSWAADAVYKRYLVNQDSAFMLGLLDEMDNDYQRWVEEKGLDNGLLWQYDVRDGMEESISGSRHDKNARPTINSYMYGNAKALARMAHTAGDESMQQDYLQKADTLKSLVQAHLWDDTARFFKVRFENGTLSDAREQIGFIPWYFNLPDDQPAYAAAWEQMLDSAGFAAPWGLTTAERRHPDFRTHGTGSCEWDGAVWPFATTQTLKGLANLLNNYSRHNMTREDYFQAFRTYAQAHQKNGKPYIGEYQDEQNGYWLKGDNPRSRYYNHSGFCDLLINDLIGIKPQEDETLVVEPLIPEGAWEWFLLDNVSYHGRKITILWDETGEKYQHGKGLKIFADGKKIGEAEQLEDIRVELPSAEI